MYEHTRVTLGNEGSADTSMLRSDTAAGEFVGKIETVTGSATVTRAGAIAPVKVGDLISQGDIVETNADGQIRISFIDGTVLNLANDTCIIVREFAWNEASPSAMFDVTQGGFSFTAGKVAKGGRLGFDTPVASIRGRTLTGGIGILSLAALYFAVVNEVQADSSNALFVDDGIITYKDFEHGVFELTTKEAVPRHIVVDDPGETVVLRRLGSSISVDHVTNSVADMTRLLNDQQAALQTFSLGLQQGPTTTGPNGSSTPTILLVPTIPINYTPPPLLNSPPPTLNNNVNSGPTGNSAPPPPVYIPPPPPVITNAAYWQSSTGGDWNDPKNWSTGTVPSPSQDIVIDLPLITAPIESPVVVSVASTLLISANATLDFVTGNEKLTVDGLFDSTGTSSIINAAITVTATGTLELTGGTLTIDPSTINNAGTLKADGAELDLSDITTFTNTGLLLATNHGLLVLSGDNVTSTSPGTVQVDYGATLNFEGSIISGGALNVSGVFDSTGISSSSITNAAVTITSTGTLELTGGTLTIDPSTINNAGTLKADGAELDLNGITTFTNTGLLLATDAGLLVLNGDTVNNVGGTIEVDSGSTIELINGTTITGGTITDSGLIDVIGSSAIDGSSGPAVDATLNGGAVTVESGQTLTLDNVTVNGTSFTDTGTIKVDAGHKLTLKGTDSISGGAITNLGTVDVAAGTTTIATDTFTNTGALLTIEGTLALNGTTITGGIITDSGLIDSTGISSITNAAITITSTGTLESTGGTLTIDPSSINNAGLLEANGGALDLDSITTFTNSGMLLATNNSPLVLNGDTVNNTGGTVQVDNGSTLTLSGTHDQWRHRHQQCHAGPDRRRHDRERHARQ